MGYGGAVRAAGFPAPWLGVSRPMCRLVREMGGGNPCLGSAARSPSRDPAFSRWGVGSRSIVTGVPADTRIPGQPPTRKPRDQRRSTPTEAAHLSGCTNRTQASGRRPPAQAPTTSGCGRHALNRSVVPVEQRSGGVSWDIPWVIPLSPLPRAGAQQPGRDPRPTRPTSACEQPAQHGRAWSNCAGCRGVSRCRWRPPPQTSEKTTIHPPLTRPHANAAVGWRRPACRHPTHRAGVDRMNGEPIGGLAQKHGYWGSRPKAGGRPDHARAPGRHRRRRTPVCVRRPIGRGAAPHAASGRPPMRRPSLLSSVLLGRSARWVGRWCPGAGPSRVGSTGRSCGPKLSKVCVCVLRGANVVGDQPHPAVVTVAAGRFSPAVVGYGYHGTVVLGDPRVPHP